MSNEPLTYAIVIHLIVDWLLQNHWMAENKANLLHPAAWVHSGLHAVALLLVFSWYWVILIGILHMLIDTRLPLKWWREFYRQTREGDVALHVAIWGDQAAHIAILAIVVAIGA